MKKFIKFFWWRLTLSPGWYMCEHKCRMKGDTRSALYWNGWFWNHRTGRSIILPISVTQITRPDYEGIYG